MTKRYHDPGDWMESPSGEYVRYEDFAKLEIALRLIEENSHLMREPVASMKSIGLIARTTLKAILPPDIAPFVETHSFDCPSLEAGPCDCSAKGKRAES